MPVCKPKVNNVLLVPVQTVAPPVTSPATVAGSTVTIAAAEFADAHIPL